MTEPEPAGSRDDHPPRIIGSNEYEFVVIGKHGNDFEVRCSSRVHPSKTTLTYVAARIRDIAHRMEHGDGA